MQRHGEALALVECHENGDELKRQAAMADADRDRAAWGLPRSSERTLRTGTPSRFAARQGRTVVNLLLAETEYQGLAMRRAVKGVLTPEDVIVHKLIAEHADAWGVHERWNQIRGS